MLLILNNLLISFINFPIKYNKSRNMYDKLLLYLGLIIKG